MESSSQGCVTEGPVSWLALVGTMVSSSRRPRVPGHMVPHSMELVLSSRAACPQVGSFLGSCPPEGWNAQSGEGCGRAWGGRRGLHGGLADAVSTHRSGVGVTGSSQTMFYAEVTDAHRSGPGGGLAEEGELIEVAHLPLDGAQAFADNLDVPKTLGVIFGVSWFLSCMAPGLGPQ